MKKLLLLPVFLFPFFAFSQIDYFRIETKDLNDPGANELKDATLHVMIKDFCDDSKPFKKILQDYWKISKISFDYDSAFDDRYERHKINICKEGEWYMFLERGFERMGSGTSYSMSTVTTITIGKNVSKKGTEISAAITIPLLPIPENGVCLPWSLLFSQSIDVSRCFLNLSNEYYLKNDIQILNQLMNDQITLKDEIALKKNDCDDKKTVLANTLYIPDYIFLKSSKCRKDLEFVDSKQYMEGYNSPYVVLTNDEMIKLFEAGKPFYYLLFGASNNWKYHFIVEGISGKIMAIDYLGGYNIGKTEMKKNYELLSNMENCK